MELVDAGAAFLAGDGRHLAARLVRRNRLPDHLADDLVQETLVALVRRGDGDDIDDVDAFVARTMHNIAVSMLRGLRRRPENLAAVVAGTDQADPLEQIPSVELPDASVLARAELRALQDELVAMLGDTPRPAAGALAVVVHVDPEDPATPASDCPVPAGGATPTEAASWVGLFYAGLRECWSDEGDPPSVRQRRSRASRAQDAVLRDAARRVGLLPGGVDA